MTRDDRVSEPKLTPTKKFKLLDVVPCVEQTAIIAAALFGRAKAKQRDRLVKQWSTMSMLGGLGALESANRYRIFLDEMDRKTFDEIRLPREGDIIVKKTAEREIKLLCGKAVQEAERARGALTATERTLPDIDLHLSPVDGKRAVANGHEGGSMSVLAGGPPASFGRPEFTREMLQFRTGRVPGEFSPKSDLRDLEETIHYLTVTIGPWLCDAIAGVCTVSERPRLVADFLFAPKSMETRDGRMILSPDQSAEMPQAEQYADADRDEAADPNFDFNVFLSKGADWNRLSTLIKQAGGYPGITALGLPKLNPANEGQAWIDPFQSWARIHNLRGSSVGASLSALIPRNGIHLSCAIARREHVIMSSVAAHALGGVVLAIPVQKLSCNGTWKGFRLHPNTRLLTSSDFVLDDQAFLVATGVSNHPALRGVQLHAGKLAHIHTLVCTSGLNSLFSRKREVRFAEEMYHGLISRKDTFEYVLEEVEQTIPKWDVQSVIKSSFDRALSQTASSSGL